MSRFAVFAFVGCLSLAAPVSGQITSAYLIRTINGEPVVEPIAPEAFPPPPSSRGLLLWSDTGGDRWLSLTDDRWPERMTAAQQLSPDRLGEAGFSRGGRGGTGTDPALGPLTRTNLVTPGNASGRPRGGELLTPVRDSYVLGPAVVVRRLPEDKGDKYPALDGEILAVGGAGPARKVVFAAGAAQVKLADVAPGVYRLVFPEVQVNFTVETPARRGEVLGRADQLAALFGPDSAVTALYTVETLLSAENPRRKRIENNAPVYLGDALDRLEATPAAKLSPYLTATRDRLREQARMLALDRLVTAADPPADPDATGVAAIDEARAALVAGKYKAAETALARVPAGNARAARLATLYRAVLLAEAGAGADAEAEALFEAVVEVIPEVDHADRFRAHANNAWFHHRRAQDRLNNNAFQMAAGLTRTMSAVAADWLTADQQYARAVKFGTPRQTVSLAGDRARLYALLADLVLALDNAPPSQELAAAAAAAADRSAGAAEAVADPIDRGIVREVRAQLAFRRGDRNGCRAAAAKALADYTSAGFLPGVENVYRLLGQTDLLDADGRPEARASAVRNLTASQLVAELLRDRLPDDQIGRARAGFLARRAFVSDALVELHLKAGQPAEDVRALEIAEFAKARAFTDLVALEGRSAGRPVGRPLAEILQTWPKNTAAVEYFLGRDRVWAFVVTPAGAVKAFELKTPEGARPVDPRDLLTRVQKVVGGMEGTARKMATRILNEQGFDNAWQEDLSDLRKILLPDAVLTELRKAQVVLLAPQHVLHYLPFAALVIERDPTASDQKLARPAKFLIDEPFVLVNVPSLTGWAALRQAKAPAVRRAANAVGLVQAPGEARLEGVEKDLANLRETFGTDVREVLNEEAATPTRASELFNRRGLLLLATHGYNDADAPLESYLVFQPDATYPDGRLRARTIYRQTVRADVVVMSACYTGLGDRSPFPGDDLFGLQRAFLQAGGRAVVAGLWDVYDLTAPDLLRGCLERLAAGIPAAQAVKEAQKSFLDRYRAAEGNSPFVHPYFWAVYSVLGDDQARVASP